MDIKFLQSTPDDVGEIIFQKKFASTFEEKDEAVEELIECLRGKYLDVDSDDDIKIRLCIEEAVTNAVEHGNECDAQKSVTVVLAGDSKKWSLRIEGEGEGFSAEEKKEPESEEDILSYRSRGLTLIISIMDEVYYFDGGNGVFLSHKKRKAED